jgi:hypothetical protein
VLVDATEPVSFLACSGHESYLVPDGGELHQLAARDEEVVGTLEALVDALDAAHSP